MNNSLALPEVRSWQGHTVVKGALLLALPILAWLAAGLGAGSWHVPDWSDPLVAQLRLPRIINAMIVGAALSMSGAALQALFRNSLADPGLLGTSSGAALAVVLVISLGLLGLTVPLAAFIGGLSATAVILLLNKVVDGGHVGLLIIGVVVGACCTAVVSLLLLLSDDMALRSATSWLAGSLVAAHYGSTWQVLPVMLLGAVLLLAVARDLDILMLDDDTAISMGIHPGRIRTLTAIGAALLTGGAVTLAGIIGFVGMMIPNAVKLCGCTSRRTLMLWSAWAGALFLLVIDTLAREVAYPIDLPAGVLAAFAGPPFFLWLFWRLQRGR